jgi:hypothetical protein
LRQRRRNLCPQPRQYFASTEQRQIKIQWHQRWRLRDQRRERLKTERSGLPEAPLSSA